MKNTFLHLITALVALTFARVVVEPPLQRDLQSVNTTELSTGNNGIAFDTDGTTKAPPPDSVQLGGPYDPYNIAPVQAVEQYKEKGSFLGCLLDATDENAGNAWPDPLARTPMSASSRWSGTLENELQTWGWSQVHFEQYYCVFDYEEGDDIGTAFRSLGLSAASKQDGGDNVCCSIEHGVEGSVDHVPYYDQHYTVDDKQYHKTGAAYRFGINHKGGAMIAMFLENPRYAVVHNWPVSNPPESDLPSLRLASDILAAYWLRDNPNPKYLRYYFALDIRNEATSQLIASTLKGRNIARVPVWPGLKVGMWEQDGEMLLGSPIGATVAFLLLQHKRELGTKHVTDVTIFRNGDEDDGEVPLVHLLFGIYDVPEPVTYVGSFGGVSIRHEQVRNDEKEFTRMHEFRLERREKVRFDSRVVAN